MFFLNKIKVPDIHRKKFQAIGFGYDLKAQIFNPRPEAYLLQSCTF